MAMESLFASTSVPDPTTDYSLLEVLITVMQRECEFIREVGIEKHVEQIAWELLQSGHYLFAANSATLYDDVVPTLQHLRDAGYKLAIVSNWDTPLDPLTESDWGSLTILIQSPPHMTCAFDPRSRIHISSTIHSQRLVFRQRKLCISGIHTQQTSSGQEDVGIRPILLDRDGTQAGRWDETIQRLS